MKMHDNHEATIQLDNVKPPAPFNAWGSRSITY